MFLIATVLQQPLKRVINNDNSTISPGELRLRNETCVTAVLRHQWIATGYDEWKVVTEPSSLTNTNTEVVVSRVSQDPMENLS